MGKSRVSPIKSTTVPRLELTAALLSCRVGKVVLSDLEIESSTETYWVDSKIVLRYLNNDSKRFRIFVANRKTKIRDLTTKEQWRYVSTKENTGDYASRGISVQQEREVSRWFKGPEFLYQPKECWSDEQVTVSISDDDPEVKKEIKVNTVQLIAENYVLCILIKYVTSEIERVRSNKSSKINRYSTVESFCGRYGFIKSWRKIVKCVKIVKLMKRLSIQLYCQK